MLGIEISIRNLFISENGIAVIWNLQSLAKLGKILKSYCWKLVEHSTNMKRSKYSLFVVNAIHMYLYAFVIITIFMQQKYEWNYVQRNEETINNVRLALYKLVSVCDISTWWTPRKPCGRMVMQEPRKMRGDAITRYPRNKEIKKEKKTQERPTRWPKPPAFRNGSPN